MLSFYARFYAQAISGLSRDTDPVSPFPPPPSFLFYSFPFFYFLPHFFFNPLAGKSVVSEQEDEVQAAEVGGGGFGVSAEEEGIASHKPVENGDQTGEPGGD